MRLRVINIGDSRVLLGRLDGTIVDGGGTDQGLTTDHKPDWPSERERIERCGGYVEVPAPHRGPARVNGDLAVSRGFGDAEYKKTGGPGPEERPVTADPELGNFECDQADFVAIVCDGVSEGTFPNPEVIKLIAEKLSQTNDCGEAARAVCLKAEQENSKDNITCMIVLMTGDHAAEDDMAFTPGPLAAPSDKKFMDAYEAMAKRADLTLAKAVEMRYDLNIDELAKPDTSEERRATLEKEQSNFGEPEGAKGSAERDAWFENWCTNARKAPPGAGTVDGLAGLDSGHMHQLLAQMQAQARMPVQNTPADGRRVRAPDEATLFAAVEEHPELKWEDRMKELAGVEGIVQTEDKSDGTMQVRFPHPLAVVAWLPTAVLTVLDDDSRPDSQADDYSSGTGGYSGGAPPTGPTIEDVTEGGA
jgi:serine/threonine protein phosphatase PrpC